MARQSHTIDTFAGGMSDSERTGIKDSANLLQALNIHEDPSYLTLNLAPSKISLSTVTNLPLWFANGRPWDTNIYSYDAGGNIYKIDSSNNVTLDRAVSVQSAAGQGLFVWNNYLYYTTATSLGRKGRLNSSPSYTGAYTGDDFLSDGTINLDQSQNLTGQTYTLPNAISETATNKLIFAPSSGLLKDPIKEIDVKLASTGTGNWTLTVHDSFNTLVGSATVNNGSLVGAGSMQPFIFSTPLRITPNGTYHFHLTSTTGDGTVTTGTASDFSTVNYKEYFGILIGSPAYHAMDSIAALLVILNDNYIATWDGFTYLPNNVTLDQGYSGWSIHRENQFVVIEAVPTQTDNLVNRGKIYYWDGIQASFNYSYDLVDGMPQSSASFKNRTFHILNTSGELYMGVEPYQKVQTLNPLLARGKSVPLVPGGMTQWGSRLFMALANGTDDANFPQGVYSFGNSSDKYPEVFQYDFLISSGDNKATTIKMGGILGAGNSLYYGWKDGASYGIDVVKKGTTAAASGTWQSFIQDGGNPQKTNLWLDFVITFAGLNTGESVQAKYQLDRSGSFTNGTLVNTVNATRCETAINARAKEIQYSFVVASTNGTFPKITGVYWSWDDLAEEIDKS